MGDALKDADVSIEEAGGKASTEIRGLGIDILGDDAWEVVDLGEDAVEYLGLEDDLLGDVLKDVDIVIGDEAVLIDADGEDALHDLVLGDDDACEEDACCEDTAR